MDNKNVDRASKNLNYVPTEQAEKKIGVEPWLSNSVNNTVKLKISSLLTQKWLHHKESVYLLQTARLFGFTFTLLIYTNPDLSLAGTPAVKLYVNLLRFDPWQWVYYWVRQPLRRARLPGPGSPTPLLQTKGPDGGAKTWPIPFLNPFHQPLSLLLSFVPVKDPKHRLTLCIPFSLCGKCPNPPLAQFGYILLHWGWPNDKLRASGRPGGQDSSPFGSSHIG